MAFVCQRCRARFQDRFEWCGSCGAVKTIVPEFERVADDLMLELDEETLVMTASQLMKRKSEKREAFGIRLGRINSIFGPPGGGKSTLAMKIADDLQDKTVYLSLEEGLSDSLVAKLKFLELCSDRIVFSAPTGVRSVVDIIDREDPDLIVIDSYTVSSFTIRDILALTSTSRTVIAILQVIKSGEAAGKMDIMHVSDVIIEVENMGWKITKSRFQGLESGRVLC